MFPSFYPRFRQTPKTIAKKVALDTTVNAPPPEPYRFALPSTGQFTSIIELISKSAQSRASAEQAFTPHRKKPDTPVDWKPDQQDQAANVGNPIPKKPEAVTTEIQTALAGITEAVGVDTRNGI